VIRLRAIRRGRGLRARAMLQALPLLTRGAAPGFATILLFRPAFFGTPFGRYCQAVLRGPGHWTVGERELFGAAVSTANACGHCTGVHRQIAVDCLGEPAVGAVVDHVGEVPADVEPALPAMTAFLRRLCHDPDGLSPADVATLHDAGISDDAIREAAHAAAVLEIANRVNSALGSDALAPAANRRSAAMLLRRGYEL
jgi:uncharacterized peroxidase-related enzyme